MSVWDDLVGQEAAVAVLSRAAAGQGHAMSHAWLITGPPGSGRSNAARAFAAALECDRGGCGVCSSCRTALSGAHPDVTVVRTEQLSIGVDEVRTLVRRASMSPTLGHRQVLVVEDADRITERGADALLKAIEEPSPRTVWLLCAPTPDDVVATIRSRCRQLHLATPTHAAVARLLVERDGVDPAMASFAARAAQGHVGRARHLARDEASRIRRREVLQLPPQLTSLGACLRAAANVVTASAEEAITSTTERDAHELAELNEALGFGTKGARPRNAASQVKDLEDQQKARVKRLQRDGLDRVLSELTTYYRDILAVQLGTDAPLVNVEQDAAIRTLARRGTPAVTMRRLDAILAARTALETNVAPLLAMEALFIDLAEAL
ncbi:MAG: DNA polymerase III subunit delta' [Actinobacteria bacterium]|nr:DNA polymerase III subunit delta' [Actinomycetota bacterium]